MTRALVIGALIGLGLAGCDPEPDPIVTLPADPATSPDRRYDPPVPLNPGVPADYPEALLGQRIGGTVLVRLFVDETGAVAPESTRVQESSGYPALDSAALAAVPRLRYAPALSDGRPVATAFIQPFHFRAPSGAAPVP